MRTRTLISAAAAAAVLALPSAAQAHVTVNPGSVPAGSYQVLSVRVPNEEDKAATTKLRLQFPAGFTSSRAGARGQAAHAGIVRRTPAPGSSVRTVKTVSITFSQRLVTGKLDVLRAGRRVAPASTGPRGASVSASFAKALPRGSYTVLWRAVVGDGHVQRGSWAFRVR